VYKYIFLLVFFIAPVCADSAIYFRCNQVGYLRIDSKTAIIGADKEIDGDQYFYLEKLPGGDVVYRGKIKNATPNLGDDSPFEFNYEVDFSSVDQTGVYRIRIMDQTSNTFAINDSCYNGIVPDLLYFLRVARCGEGKSPLHEKCHLYDATNTKLDLVGGWHDAGDFLKFTDKIAYTTYLLLLAYEYNRSDVLNADQDNNGTPDIIDEISIGLDYLSKCFPGGETFVTMVGDMDADHRLGWRLPEKDRLAKKNRPASFKFDRNDLSQFSATMALGHRVFSKIGQSEGRNDLLSLAVKAYSTALKSGNGEYDVLCLAATELYNATQKEDYLLDAMRYSGQLGESKMGSYFDTTKLAYARLGKHFPEALNKLRQSLFHISLDSGKRVFRFPIDYVWGSLNVAMSVGCAAFLYEVETKDDQFYKLASAIKNYSLGTNPWGVSFISNHGDRYPVDIHNRLAQALKEKGVLKEGTIRGAVAEGPIGRDEWENRYSRKIRIDFDKFAKFQPNDCVYHDHPFNYVTNEPTIYGVAEAVLFFSFYSNPHSN